MKSSNEKGKKGEIIAADFLINKGYEILKRNFRTSCGEIDIIASIEGIIAFVEVKARWRIKLGLPCEAVDDKKQARIIETAKCYLSNEDMPCRFDVIEVYFAEKKIRHIKNAFEVKQNRGYNED